MYSALVQDIFKWKVKLANDKGRLKRTIGLDEPKEEIKRKKLEDYTGKDEERKALFVLKIFSHPFSNGKRHGTHSF